MVLLIVCFHAAECMLHTTRNGKANHRLKWYDTECFSKKKELRRFLNKYNRSLEEMK